MKLPLNKIRTDGGTQPRAVIDEDAVHRYVELMTSGVEFPPVDVFHDGESYWLADGFHRYRAVDSLDWDEIDCNIHQGTLADAQWFSFSANKANGLHRSKEDVRRAVMAALQMRSELSDVEIARHVGVHRHTVQGHRKDMEAQTGHLVQNGQDAPEAQHAGTRTVTRKGKTYKMKVGQIGKAKKPRMGRLSKDHFPAMKLRPDLPANVCQVKADAVRVELSTNHVGNCAYALYHTFVWSYLEQVIHEVCALAAQDQKGKSK